MDTKSAPPDLKRNPLIRRTPVLMPPPATSSPAQRTIGYIRVSTPEQDTEKNRADILRLANDKHFGHVKFVEETVSGKKPWKTRKIKEVIDSLTKGDRLIVPELSRLGRSMLEIMEIMAIAQERGAEIYAIKGNWRLDNSIQSKVMAMVFSMVAEIERDLISERTKEGLRARKAKGVKLGRPRGPGKSKLDPHREEIVALLKCRSPKTFVAAKYGCKVGTLNNWLKKNRLTAEIMEGVPT
jgi:DNA invertase Pin-like site-specific DNA recombinase